MEQAFIERMPDMQVRPGKDCYNLNFIAHLYGSDLVKGLNPS